VVFLFMFLGAPVTAAAPIPEPLTTKEDMQEYALHKATEAGVNPTVVFNVIDCETMHTWNPVIQSTYKNRADGGRELSFGLAQIHMPDHPDVSMEQATDPRFAINFLVENLKNHKGNMWSCYRKLY
jgi:hypothetical protein